MAAGSEAATFEAIWSEALGCAPADLRGDRTVVVPHGPALRCGHVVWVVRSGTACVVSAPAPMAGPLSPLAPRHSPDEWFDRQFLFDVLRHPVRAVVGPACLASAGGEKPAWQSLLPGRQIPPGRSECARYYAVLLKPTWP